MIQAERFTKAPEFVQNAVAETDIFVSHSKKTAERVKNIVLNLACVLAGPFLGGSDSAKIFADHSSQMARSIFENRSFLKEQVIYEIQNKFHIH